eukprot:CAMPEP_0184483294 /NCGR_PEP_ID=MMETSP0113_2-20130426/4936_1 /TAXON_ID=91329 /ORGANISM="Norrisiella sphaerica, Strain BC52" /LENGTH=145 /DNA_ID=CAMNT_0026863597 /DNA_START=1537 /DNA_END=1974 /DNA_ORIENTATION=+
MVKKTLDSGLERVQNWAAILDQNHSQGSEEAINTLHGALRGEDGKVKDVLVSKCVLQELHRKAPNALAKTHELASVLRNPSFLGWVVECDFLQLAKKTADKNGTLTLLDQDGKKKFEMKLSSCGSFNGIEETEWTDGKIRKNLDA